MRDGDDAPVDALDLSEPTPPDEREYRVTANNTKLRTVFQVERDRAYVARAYLSGLAISKMAKELGVSTGTVQNDIEAIKEEWRKSQLIDFTYAVNQELAKIDALEQTYWIAWRDSQKDERTVTEEENEQQTKYGTGVFTKNKTRTTKPNTGQPFALAGIQWCIDRRIKLLGLDAPTKIAPTTPDGKESYDPHAAENRVAAMLGAFINRTGVAASPESGRPQIVSGVATER